MPGGRPLDGGYCGANASSRQRAAGAAGADGEALPVGKPGLGVATGSGTLRATGGVSGT